MSSMPTVPLYDTFPPRPRQNLWPSRIHSGYQNLRLLVCPNDGPNPGSWGTPTPLYPADGVPRSYICNAWNDHMKVTLTEAEMSQYMAGDYPGSIKASAIRQPSDTIVLGEKMTISIHYHMDLLELERTGAVGNDLFQLERSRHGGAGAQTGTGGSNYSFADGSVRFVRFNRVLGPINLGAVTAAGRIAYAVNQ